MWEDYIKMDLRKWIVETWNESSCMMIGQVVGTCKCGNAILGFTKCREVLD
jgi:hypothetical protein